MSHFYVISLLPKSSMDVAEDVIATLMEPYSEEKKVPEYDSPCFCVTHKQHKLQHDKVEKEAGMTWKEAKEKFNEIHKDDPKPNSKTATPESLGEHFDKEEKQWKEFTKKLRELDTKYKDEDFDVKPDPKCDECHGKGTNKSTYNPNSKWDWYVVGGRWNGVIQQKPEDDEKGFNFGDEYHQLNKNFASVKQLIKSKEIPYAILTPDGEWLERGHMGYFGMSSNEKPKETWEEQALQIYEKYNDCIAVGLDCHI